MRALMIMILGFILIIAMLMIRYKTVYEVKLGSEILGYVSDAKLLKESINEEILNVKEENVYNISLTEEPQYEYKLIKRSKETNEEEIISKLKNATVTTYKFYAIALNNKNETYVDTIEEAEEVVNQIKSEYEGNGLDLDLTIVEKYTENVNEVKTDVVEVAEASFDDDIEKLIDEKEATEAIATINGINLSVLPVSGHITSRYGESSSIRVSTHTGLDIACPTGTDIKAVSKGIVVFAGRNGSYGNLVKIDHGNGIETWYAHCNKIYVSVGEKVTAGDIIAAVGSTGNSTGSHLHLEIRINGSTVNPQNYLYK